MTAVAARALAMTLMILGVSCGRVTGSGEEPTSPIPTESPTSSSVALELRTDGLGDFSFGRPMVKVFPALVELLGEPVGDIQVHGDMPMGWGDVDTMVRLVDFDGIRVVFDDWKGYFRKDGVMHLVSWSVEKRQVSNGLVLATPEGISVGANVPDLQAAFGSSLHLPDVGQPGCGGPPWYFAVAPEEPWGLIGSLSGPPSNPHAHVEGMAAGASKEGWIPCWEP